MDKEITYEEFSREVRILWNMEEFCYGSVQYPAMRARDEFTKQGITNATEMYEEYKRKSGPSFYYAGD